MADDFRGYDGWKNTDEREQQPMVVHMCPRGHVRLTNLPTVCWQCIAQAKKEHAA